MPPFTLPALPSFDLFRQADADTLLRLYRELFRRVAANEGELFVFAEGGFRPKVVLDELDEALRRWPNPADRPPLFGVPVGVKDVFRTNGYAVRCGSLLPSSLFSGDEAPLVTRLREAGAIVMGITASTEFTHGFPFSFCAGSGPGLSFRPDREPLGREPRAGFTECPFAWGGEEWRSLGHRRAKVLRKQAVMIRAS